MREFDIRHALAEMLKIGVAIEHETHKALTRAAELVEHEAKAEIGHYQDAAGPLAEWAQLAPSTIAEKEALGYAPPDNPLLREGDLRDSIGHKVETHFNLSGGEAAIGSDSDIAVYQELGTGHIPPRSFLGGAAVREEEKVVEILGGGVVSGLVGKEVFRGYFPLRGT